MTLDLAMGLLLLTWALVLSGGWFLWARALHRNYFGWSFGAVAFGAMTLIYSLLLLGFLYVTAFGFLMRHSEVFIYG